MSNGSLCGTRTCTKTNTNCALNIGKPIERLSCGGGGVSPDSTCGDAFCDVTETQYSCPEDCGYPSDEPALVEDVCGDGTCGSTETSYTCADDCEVEKGKSYLWLFVIIVILLLAGIITVIVFIIRYFMQKKKMRKYAETSSAGA